jgi:putative membrane protein
MTRRRAIDRRRVREAVEAAERRTAAEIVVAIAPFFIGDVWRAARRAFLRLDLARTHDRTGILVFVVPARHQVVVLADEGAHARIDGALWHDVASHIADAFSRDDGTAGLVHGIDRIAAASSVPFPREPRDVHEVLQAVAPELQIRRL